MPMRKDKFSNKPKIPPEGNATREELVATYSIFRNEYFACKWQHFLNNIPHTAVIIRNLDELRKKKDPIRKMILNGTFLSANGEVIPVPYLKK